ncbi:MAG TPA: PIN domain-containing protein, partial [Longimicrobium sp.]|nr:PIN domain-containing protein [Longimicrobium sp.]
RFYTVLQEGGRFVVSETILTEIFRHKEKMIAAARVEADEMAEAYHALLTLLEIRKESSIPRECWEQAVELCRGVDPDDAPPVALTLAVDGLLWTGDKALQAGLRAKGFNRFFVP